MTEKERKRMVDKVIESLYHEKRKTESFKGSDAICSADDVYRGVAIAKVGLMADLDILTVPEALTLMNEITEW